MAQKPDYWDEAVETLSGHDPVMAEIIARFPGESLVRKHDAFITFAKAITGQQISVKAADSIWARMEDVVAAMTPESFLAAEEEELRGAGLSRQKVDYLRGIAEHFTEGRIDVAELENWEEEQAIKELVKIRGVGRWTAEMFLIFHLLKPNVLPLGDVGVKKAIKINYNPNIPPPACGRRLGGGWGEVNTDPNSNRNKTTIKKAKELRKQYTDAEAKLWKHLRGKQLSGYKFRRQQSVGKYIVDFLCHDKNLIIELDGSQHAENIAYDNRRTQYLKKKDYRVIRFWNNEILQHTESVLQFIYNTLHDDSHPHPNPPPQAGEGILTQEEIEKITANWQPWRTVATWYLWRSLDPVPVQY